MQKQKIKFIEMIISLIIATSLEVVEIVFAFKGSDSSMPIWLEWVSFILCSIVIFILGWRFLLYCYEEIFKHKMVGMYTMLSLCVIISYCFSFYPLIQNTINSINHQPHEPMMTFFPTAAIIVSVVNLGNFLTTKLEHKAENDIEAIAAMRVNDSLLFDIKTKKTSSIKTDLLKIGNLIQINKGSSVPIDCKIFKGKTYIDESSITGESRHLSKKEGDTLLSGTINVGNTIVGKVIRNSSDSTLNQIIKNVQQIQAEKPKYQKMADKVSKWFVPTIIVLSLITFFIQAFVPGIESVSSDWFLGGSRSENKFISAAYYAVAVLAVSCPCALGIAVPLASLSGVSKASKNGIIINHASSYENAHKIDLIAFDKTGTLTKGKFEVVKFIGNKNNLSIIYAMESKSIHPLANSFVNFCNNKHSIKVKSKNLNVKENPGIGLSCNYQQSHYQIVSLPYILENKMKLHFNKIVEKEFNKIENSSSKDLISLAFFIKNNSVENLIVFEDSLNENTIETIKVLKMRNKEIYMITGDNEKTARILAKRLGIKFFANVLPHQKAEIVKQFQEQNKKVCYVGDGINDLEVLKQADLSIAINKENAVANSISDISIINTNIMNVIKSIFITNLIRKMIIMNLLWSFFYNVVTIPLTMLGYLPAFLAVVAMSCSEIFVLGNSIFFKSKKFSYITRKEIKKLKLRDNEYKM